MRVLLILLYVLWLASILSFLFSVYLFFPDKGVAYNDFHSGIVITTILGALISFLLLILSGIYYLIKNRSKISEKSLLIGIFLFFLPIIILIIGIFFLDSYIYAVTDDPSRVNSALNF